MSPASPRPLLAAAPAKCGHGSATLNFDSLECSLCDGMYAFSHWQGRVSDRRSGECHMANRLSVEAVVGQSLQTAYAIWMTSLAVLPMGVWAVLGAGIAVGAAFR